MGRAQHRHRGADEAVRKIELANRVVRFGDLPPFIAVDHVHYGTKMKIAAAFALSSLCVISANVLAAEPTLESMVTCQHSWLDWKENPAPGKKFLETLHADYTANSTEGYLVPKTKTTLFGLPVTRVYTDSVGMGLGFSVVVAAKFDAAQKAVEKAVGKSLTCEPDSDGMHACEVSLGTNKNVTLASDAGDAKTVLVGCFYYYEK